MAEGESKCAINEHDRKLVYIMGGVMLCCLTFCAILIFLAIKLKRQLMKEKQGTYNRSAVRSVDNTDDHPYGVIPTTTTGNTDHRASSRTNENATDWSRTNHNAAYVSYTRDNDNVDSTNMLTTRNAGTFTNAVDRASSRSGSSGIGSMRSVIADSQSLPM